LLLLVFRYWRRSAAADDRGLDHFGKNSLVKVAAKSILAGPFGCR
jgi:hypothetical protein